MQTDDRLSQPTHKEVPVVRRVLIVAAVVTAVLVLAAPALAFDGFRSTYTSATATCIMCHSAGTSPIAVYNGWASTKHADSGLDAGGVPVTANAEPIANGPRCAGCHSGNYDPSKASPIPTVLPSATATSFVYAHENTAGDDAFTEPYIGCSSCHYGAGVINGTDPADTAHMVPYANMASAEICGQCHSRFSKTVKSYPIIATTPGAPTTIQPEYTVGDFNPLGAATSSPIPWTADPLSAFLQVPTTAAPVNQVYYKDAQGNALPFVAKAHAGGATQYEDWAQPQDLHSVALKTLTDLGTGSFLNSCLKCHSTDYRIIDEWNKQRGLKAGDPGYRTLPTITTAKYGITCQACHTTHDKGASPSAGVWNQDFDTQLKAPAKQLCVGCHTAELDANPTPGVATPGEAVHHPMKEMMDGTGAIDVPQGSPSVHKGKCVQCHMPPTGYGQGVAGTAANHVFQIIQPQEAEQATATVSVGGVTGPNPMPYSACSKCHARPGDDRAVWIQDTLTDRQSAMHNWDDQVTAALGAAATKLGFAGATAADKRANANAALNAIGQGKWNASQLLFQKAFTNQQYIESEGSWGIHNWDYARTVILKALDEAQAVTAVKAVTLKASATHVKPNATVKFTGAVRTSATGVVTIQRKANGKWVAAKSANLTAGSYAAALKLTRTGTFYFRARFAATAEQAGGTSRVVKVVVR